MTGIFLMPNFVKKKKFFKRLTSITTMVIIPFKTDFLCFLMFYVFPQENRIIVRPFFSIKWNITITLYCYLFWQSHILFLRQIQKIYILFHSSLQWLYLQIKSTCNDCQCLILVNEAPEEPILFKLQFYSVSNFPYLDYY